MRAKQPSVLRGIITGATAGIAATLIMDQFFKLTSAGQKAVEKQMKLAQGESPWEIAHEQVQQEQQAAEREDSTEIVARKIAEATGKTLDKEKKKKAGRAVHYTFGTLMGIFPRQPTLPPPTTSNTGPPTSSTEALSNSSAASSGASFKPRRVATSTRLR